MKVAFLCLSHPHCAGRLRAAAKLGGVELAGVFDPDARLANEVATEQQARLFNSADELLNDDTLDLIIIEGTNSQNAQFAVESANAGKAMLIEKPCAPNAAKSSDVLNAVRKAGVFCQVGYHLRYSPAVQRGLILAKRLGRITTARFHAAVMQPWLTNEWFCDESDMGGMVFLDFCHMLDLLTLFLGDLTAHNAKIIKLQDVPPHPFEDSAAFVLEFGDVLAAGDCCGWEANDWITTWDIELYGTEGTLKLGIHPPWTEVFTPSNGWQREDVSSFDGEMNYYYEIADIANCIKSGNVQMGCDIYQAHKLIHILSEMYESSAGFSK